MQQWHVAWSWHDSLNHLSEIVIAGGSPIGPTNRAVLKEMRMPLVDVQITQSGGQVVLVGAAIGVVLALVPFFVGMAMSRIGFAIICLPVCAFVGGIGGVVFVSPLAILLALAIYSVGKPKKPDGT